MTLHWLYPAGGEVLSLEQAYDPGDQPSLRAGFVLSIDGAVSIDGTSAGLSSAADKQVFRALRAVTDAVLVGAGTARSEDYRTIHPSPTGALWRAARNLPPAPLVIVTATCELSPTARCFAPGATRTIVVTCAGADPGLRGALADVADVLVLGGASVHLAAMVSALHELGLTRLLCEGGPALLTDLLSAGLVDEMCLTSAPVLTGSGAPTLLTRSLETAIRLAPVHLLSGEDGELLGRWRVLPA